MSVFFSFSPHPLFHIHSLHLSFSLFPCLSPPLSLSVAFSPSLFSNLHLSLTVSLFLFVHILPFIRSSLYLSLTPSLFLFITHLSFPFSLYLCTSLSHFSNFISNIFFWFAHIMNYLKSRKEKSILLSAYVCTKHDIYLLFTPQLRNTNDVYKKTMYDRIYDSHNTAPEFYGIGSQFY